MELAMLITETTSHADRAFGAFQDGEVDAAKRILDKLRILLHSEIALISPDPEPEPEKPATTQESDRPKDGDG